MSLLVWETINLEKNISGNGYGGKVGSWVMGRNAHCEKLIGSYSQEAFKNKEMGKALK